MSVLGSMILDGSAKTYAAGYLSRRDFFRPAHQTMFMAISGLDGEPDLVRLKHALGQELAACGGDDYLIQVAEYVPSSANVRHYAEIVKQKARVRRLISIGTKIQATKFDDLNGEFNTKLDRIQADLRSIARDGFVEPPDWVTMDSVKAEQPPWIFRPILAEGLFSLIEGEPGDGKSSIAAAITGAVTTGRGIPGLPDQPLHPPGAAILLCAEDSLNFSLASRLKCVGADTSRVLAKEGPFELNIKGITKIQRMADEARQIAGEGPVFFSIDPIMAYIGSGKNTNADNEVRDALKDLYALVAEYRLLPLAATHMNKGGDKALSRVMGSVAFAAMPRVVMMAGRDPEDDKKGVLSCVKSNIGPRFRSLGYVIDEDPDGWMTFSWAIDGSDVSADEMTAPRMPHARKKRDAPKMDEFKVWLLGTLAGAALRKDALDERCEDAGYNPRYLYKVREDMELDIRTQPKAPGEGKGPPRTWWALPHHDWTHLEESWRPAQAELAPEPDPFPDE